MHIIIKVKRRPGPDTCMWPGKGLRGKVRGRSIR